MHFEHFFLLIAEFVSSSSSFKFAASVPDDQLFGVAAGHVLHGGCAVVGISGAVLVEPHFGAECVLQRDFFLRLR